ncbi:AraC family transcriptional regulator [Paenibacillus sp. sgz5001063]|uniref:AraC family transcriptional regulator n=1 Tax=Paenibacillus sp. sgz5001063 TaxID=3242474 RepID=UPI0036D2266C
MFEVMDYMISPYPIRIIDPRVESSRLRLKTIQIGQTGHLPGRILFRSNAVFEHWALVYILSGNGTFMENDGKIQQVRAGSLFFFRPGCNYCFGPQAGGSWDEYYINFTGTRVTEWLEAGLIEGGRVFEAAAFSGLSSIFEQVLRLMEGGVPADADRAAAMLEGILLECSLITQGFSWTREADIMPQIREDLNSCIYGKPDLRDIAARHHISMSTLRRLVRRSSGYPLHEYIHRLKMAEAKHLLLNTSLQVKAIAGMLHYGDCFYFSRLFKKYMGVSPLICRKSL